MLLTSQKHNPASFKVVVLKLWYAYH